jgi:hypothetical protein
VFVLLLFSRLQLRQLFSGDTCITRVCTQHGSGCRLPHYAPRILSKHPSNYQEAMPEMPAPNQ